MRWQVLLALVVIEIVYLLIGGTVFWALESQTSAQTTGQSPTINLTILVDTLYGQYNNTVYLHMYIRHAVRSVQQHSVLKYVHTTNCTVSTTTKCTYICTYDTLYGQYNNSVYLHMYIRHAVRSVQQLCVLIYVHTTRCTVSTTTQCSYICTYDTLYGQYNITVYLHMYIRQTVGSVQQLCVLSYIHTTSCTVSTTTLCTYICTYDRLNGQYNNSVYLHMYILQAVWSVPQHCVLIYVHTTSCTVSRLTLSI